MVPIEEKENRKTRKCKITFIDTVRFMASSLPSLADNLSEYFHKSKFKSYKLSYKLECNKNYKKKFDRNYLRDSKTHISPGWRH